MSEKIPNTFKEIITALEKSGLKTHKEIYQEINQKIKELEESPNLKHLKRKDLIKLALEDFKSRYFQEKPKTGPEILERQHNDPNFNPSDPNELHYTP
ncbi:MAG: hypothetical protein HYU63_05960 [Armatimonadetes bacterium]|nr:hypothetical protein [Armatimonadota bacterium]